MKNYLERDLYDYHKIIDTERCSDTEKHMVDTEQDRLIIHLFTHQCQ